MASATPWGASVESDRRSVSAADLLRVVDQLPVRQPITDAFERQRADSRQSSRNPRTWYGSQKEHLHGWLAEYNGPGAYGRRDHHGDARQFYQRFQCVAGLLWLAEALGESPEVLRAAVADIDVAGSRNASQCAAFRRRVPWERIEELLER